MNFIAEVIVILVFTILMKNLLIYFVIDTPPNLGLFCISALLSADYVVIPIDASIYSLRGLDDLLATIDEVRENNEKLRIAGIILNQLNVRTIVGQEVEKEIRKRFSKLYLGFVKQSVRARETAFMRRPNVKLYEGVFKELEVRIFGEKERLD